MIEVKHGCGSCGQPGCCAVNDCGYKWQIEGLEGLLRRIRSWDMLDACADGPFWRGEIDTALQALEQARAEDAAGAPGVTCPEPLAAVSAALRNSASGVWLGVWQSIETAPKDGTRVLAFQAINQSVQTAWRRSPWVAFWDRCWMTSPGLYAVEPTHWMPLSLCEPPRTDDAR